jgi:hypothetical protein
MSVNLSHATPMDKRHNRWGKNYYSIDFELNDKLSSSAYARQFDKQATRPVVGVLEIGKSKVPVTLKELEKLRETITEAMYTVDVAYRLGKLR